MAMIAPLPGGGTPTAQEPGPATDVTVRILEPTKGSYIAGSTSVEAEITLPDGETVTAVDFEVDGVVVATLNEPPWRLVHDFGRTYQAWFIRVVATTGSGRQVDATVTTQALAIHQEAGVDLVNVFVTVQDERGRYIMDLDEDEFILFEDARRQSISHFSRDRLPLAVEILLDTSLSMEGRALEEAQDAARQFLGALEPDDVAGVMSFNDTVNDLHPLDHDRERAEEAIKSSWARGGTALYDGVAEAALRLKGISDDDRRRAIILLSDGRDEASSGLTPGSVLTFEESLAEVVQSNVILYSIGLGRDLDKKVDFYGRYSLEEILTILAAETGGRAFFTPRAERLKKTYKEIETELRHHYSLAYSPINSKQDGSWRRIELRLSRPRLVVNARRGYYAPDDDLVP